MTWIILIMKLMALCASYLSSKQLLDAGEAQAINDMITRAKERLDVAKNIAINVANIPDEFLQPSKLKDKGNGEGR